MNTISIKTNEEITIMREGGKILAELLDNIKMMIKPGIDVWELEKKFIDLCSKNGVIPSCKGYAPGGYPPFPVGLCIGINNQAVHCYPVKNTIINDGDIVNVDTVIKYKYMHVDSSFAIGVGKVSKNKQKLLDTSKKALLDAISHIKNNVKIGVLSNTMEKHAKNNGYSVLQEYAGHGIGKEMHEPPEIPCFGSPLSGSIIKTGMTLAVESLFCEKNPRLIHQNVWQTALIDGGNFVQFEHTVLVLDNGYEILTKL